MKKRLGWIAVLSALPVLFFLALSLRKEGTSEAASGMRRVGVPLESPLYKEGEILVQMKPGISKSASLSVHSAFGAAKIEDLGGGAELVKLPAGMSVNEAVALYSANANVSEASPNYYQRVRQTFPNDPSFGFLWGMNNTGQTGGTPDADIDAPEAWELTTGDPGVVIAVVDTGVDYNHPDLVANMWINPGEVAGNGIDDDLNGYIDDVHGINAIDGVTSPGDPLDDNGHGTHVAGTIGAVGNNSAGVTGINWNVKIMALKFLTSEGFGAVSDEVECLNYIADQADRGQKIVAVNASFGSYSPLFSFEQNAIDNLRQRGILFVAAAGNGDVNGNGVENDELLHIPSSYDLPNLISVAATNDTDNLSGFSNFGRRTVHVGAPGESIFSTLLGGTYGPFDTGFSGTSMGTPHVVGTIGLLYARFPVLNPVTDWPLVRNRILTGGDIDQFLAGRTVTGRRLNAFGALTCSGTTVLARIRPLTSLTKSWLSGGITFYIPDPLPERNEATVFFGQDIFGNAFSIPLKLSALHINCEQPNGNVVVNVGGQAVTLLDGGVSPDRVAGDGVYTSAWNPPLAETDLVATFPNTGTSIAPFTDSFVVHVRRTDDRNGFVVADAGVSQTVEGGSVVDLDGRISTRRPEMSPVLTYTWTQTRGTNVTLNFDDTPFPFFTAPSATGGPDDTLVFELEVSDLDGNTATDTTAVTVAAPAAAGGGGGGGGSSCFIATAAYGSENARDVVVLRQFRDRYLITNAPGAAFTNLYYKLSPPVASLIANRPALKKTVRIGLTPAVGFAQVMLETTGAEKLVMSLLLVSLAISLVIFRQRHKRLVHSGDSI
ncbi:S8 family serine peptidase [Candidatus Poribacteria bacterium]|nr:S8 family serine peptidase [Candidatus Poribacteria bacterium]